MADIAEIGFVADTSDLKAATKDLNKLTPATDKAERATDRLNDQMARGSTIGGRFSRVMVGAAKGLGAFAGGIIGGFAFMGIEQTVQNLLTGLINIADQAERMGNIAAAAGGTVGGVQILSMSLKAAGVEIGEVESAAKNLNRALGDIAIGSGPGAKLAKAALDELGLSADQLRTMDVDQRFIAIGNSLKALGLSASESAALLDNLGIKSTNMIAALSGGGDVIDDVRDQINKLGLALTVVDTENLANLDAAFDELGVTGEAAAMKVAAAFAPLLTMVVNEVNGFLNTTMKELKAIYDLGVLINNFGWDLAAGTVKPTGGNEDEVIRNIGLGHLLDKTFNQLSETATKTTHSMNGLFDTVDNFGVAATGVTPTIETLNAKTELFDATTSALTPTIESLASGFDTIGVSATALGSDGGALDAATERMEEFAKQADIVREKSYELRETIAGYVVDAFKGFFSGLRQGMSVVDAFGDAIGRLADRLLDMVLDGALNSIIGSMFGLGSIAGGAAIPSGGFIPGITGPKLFAKGGVFGAPTMFDTGSGLGMAGEAGPEAILPLHRAANGGLGVAMAGNDNYVGNPIMLNVAIYNNASNDVDATATVGDDGSLIVQIDRIVAKNIADPGSQTNKAVTRSFGNRNKTVSR